jgi:hypothetical protein
MTDQPTSAIELPIRTHVRKILRATAAQDEADAEKIRELEASGLRIVDGGQLSGDSWEIHDWRTGARIAAGDDGHDGYDAACERLDPDGKWRHIDRVLEDAELPVASSTEGVPPTLSDALHEWVASPSTPHEDIAEIADWDASEIERCLADPRTR